MKNREDGKNEDGSDQERKLSLKFKLKKCRILFCFINFMFPFHSSHIICYVLLFIRQRERD